MTDDCQGVYEVCIGVPDLSAAAAHWEAFGFSVSQRGSLDARDAKGLYGIHSGLTSWRLAHGQSDKGLIRLMRWEKPIGSGLQMASLRTPGNRWTVQKTDDLLSVWTHSEVAMKLGQTIHQVGPVLNARASIPLLEQQPFQAPVPATYNLQIFQPLFQQVIMQRLNIDAHRLGSICTSSLMRTSEICHVGLVALNQPITLFDFYERALGLARTTQRRFPFDPDSPASTMFGLRPNEAFTEIDFDDPRALKNANTPLSGRLRVFALESPERSIDTLDACLGVLGYSAYSTRTKNIRSIHQRVLQHGAHDATDLQNDEFGCLAFSFRAPDHYHWIATSADTD